MTPAQFSTICPELDAVRAAAFFPHFVQAEAEAEVTTAVREAAFIAQLAHESAEFQIWRELWGPTADQKNYERPKLADGTLAPLATVKPYPLWQVLGNYYEGDGKRYRGRGPIQITGRDTYKAAGRALGLDLVQSPDLLCQPILTTGTKDPAPGFRSAAWFWRTRGCNAFADSGDFVGLTRRINGGTNGLAERQRYWELAKQVLGVEG